MESGALSPINVSGLAAILSGFLSFFTPCILPLVPSYLIYISGITVGDVAAPTKAHRRRVFFHSLSFVLGFSFVFVALGVSTSLPSIRRSSYASGGSSSFSSASSTSTL